MKARSYSGSSRFLSFVWMSSVKSSIQSLSKSRSEHFVSSSKGCFLCCRRFLALTISSNISVTIQTFQLHLCRFLGQSIAEICFSRTSSPLFVSFLPGSPSSQWLFVFLPLPKAPMLHTSSHRLTLRLSPSHFQHAVPSRQLCQESLETQKFCQLRSLEV